MNEPVHRLAVRVYYEDTDFSGAVYHANYLRFMERGRTEFIRSRGIEHSRLRDAAGEPLGFVVRRMNVEFLHPGQMDDLLTVVTEVGKRGGASLVMAQHVLRGEQVLVTADVTVALVGGGRPRRLPPDLVAKLFD